MYGGELTVGINVTSEIKPLKKVLLHRPGKEIENYAIQLDSLEAGQTAYIERNKTYENLKN